MGYDDWNRLLSDNCGSVWAQTFSYDQYDNLTKSGSLTWNPGYSPTTNHYTLAGTIYDSSGNVTNDSFNAYAWNAFNKLQSVNVNGANCATSGACIVYDAFGRAVEIDSGSTHTEIWYTQLGKTAYMNGTTYNYAYWPAPGGSTILEKTGGFYYFQHKDWLGSARIASSIGIPSIIDDRAFAPYGEMYDNFGSTSANENIYTGDTQDILATGNCCFDTPNRELSANQGRWLSPDPAGAGWNQYAYISNSPLRGNDPLGLFVVDCEWIGCPGSACPNCGGSNGGLTGGPGYIGSTAPGGIFFGGLLWNREAQEEARHLSIISTGWDPELGIDRSSTSYWFTDPNGNAISNQKTIDAIAFGQQACRGMGGDDVASCIQQTYNTMGPAAGFEGGHYDFNAANIQITINGENIDTNPSDFGCLGGRCGIFNSLDYSHGGGMFHVDMANVYFFPIGTLIHLGADKIGGSTWWSGGVPPFPLP